MNNKRQGHSNIHDLYFSILHGSIRNIDQYLLHGGLRDMTGPNGRTFLIGCIEENYVEKFKYFIKRGCDINKADSDKRTPLYTAFLMGKKDFVNLLLEARCDVNAANIDGMTPVMCCAESGDIQSVEILLQNSCMFNCRNDIGETALHIAVSEGHTQIVERLIEAGVDVNIPNNERDTPLVIASKRKMRTLLQLMLDKCEVCRNSINLDRSLFVCCDAKYLYGIDILLKYGANPFTVYTGTVGMTRVIPLRSFSEMCAASHIFMQLYCVVGDKYECPSPMSLIGLGVSGIILISIIENYGKSTLCSRENQLLRLLFDNHKGFMFKLGMCLQVLFCYGFDRAGLLDLFPCDAVCPCRKLITGCGISPEKPTPLSLLSLTRNTIRCCMDAGITRKAPKLGLPKALENVVTLKAYLQ